MMYYVDADDFEQLKYIEKALYGNGSSLTADQRRDLANALNYINRHIESNPIKTD